MLLRPIYMSKLGRYYFKVPKTFPPNNIRPTLLNMGWTYMILPCGSKPLGSPLCVLMRLWLFADHGARGVPVYRIIGKNQSRGQVTITRYRWSRWVGITYSWSPGKRSNNDMTTLYRRYVWLLSRDTCLIQFHEVVRRLSVYRCHFVIVLHCLWWVPGCGAVIFERRGRGIHLRSETLTKL